MGDRGNIVMRFGSGETKQDIFFYGHWSGSEMPALLQKALARKQRWSDSSYLARIVFNTLTEGHEKDETGFGISPFVCDNEHALLVVDTDAQKVEWYAERGFGSAQPLRSWSFAEFCGLTEKDIRKLGNSNRNGKPYEDDSED